MNNPFLVSVKCPECGGPVKYPEGAYTFRCLYCDSTLRAVAEGQGLKYVIPSRLGEDGVLSAVKAILAAKKDEYGKLTKIRRIRVFYKPFWHCKGMIYGSFIAKRKNEVIGKMWGHTFQANPGFLPSFYSLGIKSEVLTLEPYDSDGFAGTTVLPILIGGKEAEETAFKAAERNLDTEMGKWSFRKTRMIGEKLFIIYYPVVSAFCAGPGGSGRLFFLDGVDGSLLGHEEGKAPAEPEDKGAREAYRMELLSHRCENCGNDLESRDFDIVYYCRSCFRLWLLKGGGYESLRIRMLEPAGGTSLVYVPFWKFAVEVVSVSAGVVMKTVGELGGFMKMGGFVLRNEDPSRPLNLWVPALVTRNAGAALKLSARICTFQKNLPVSKSEDFPFERILNASLPESEAAEMLEPLIFSVIGRVDDKALAFYSDARITPLSAEMIWYPFEEKGDMLVDNFHGYNFPKRAMDVNVYRSAEPPAPSRKRPRGGNSDLP